VGSELSKRGKQIRRDTIALSKANGGYHYGGATANLRGHLVFWDGKTWRYSDDHSRALDNRPCARCNKPPTAEGYDACLGYILGVFTACCGHGVGPRYIQ